MFDCLAGCISKYKNGKLIGNDYGRGGIDTENYSPFIWIKLSSSGEGGASEITVGNKSYGKNNTAIVKSIDFGWINTLQGSVEILDEQGSAFNIFVEALQKCSSRIGTGSTMEYKIGWVYTGCDGGKKSVIESPVMKSMIGEIQVNYGQVMKYKINFSQITPMVYDHRHPIVFGEEEEGKKIHLEDAIEKLCEIPPKVNVKFAWRDESGEIQFGHHKWIKGGLKGPKDCWKGDRQNKYAAIERWISEYLIDDGKKGKSAVLIHNPKVPDELWVFRDPEAMPGEMVEVSSIPSLGTFIVNGGKCSNVIEFSPNFNFINAAIMNSSGGGTSGGIKTGNVELKDLKEPQTEGKFCCNSEDAGVQQQVSASDSSIRVYGKEAPEKVNEARLANAKANRITTMISPIEADLRIIGDPSPEYFLPGLKHASIIVINPNFLQKASDGSCTDWLKKSDCNKYLSNKAWFVKGINHSVREGSYVTTLKVALWPPGISNESGGKLGANETGAELKSEC